MSTTYLKKAKIFHNLDNYLGMIKSFKAKPSINKGRSLILENYLVGAITNSCISSVKDLPDGLNDFLSPFYKVYAYTLVFSRKSRNKLMQLYDKYQPVLLLATKQVVDGFPDVLEGLSFSNSEYVRKIMTIFIAAENNKELYSDLCKILKKLDNDVYALCYTQPKKEISTVCLDLQAQFSKENHAGEEEADKIIDTAVESIRAVLSTFHLDIEHFCKLYEQGSNLVTLDSICARIGYLRRACSYLYLTKHAYGDFFNLKVDDDSSYDCEIISFVEYMYECITSFADFYIDEKATYATFFDYMNNEFGNEFDDFVNKAHDWVVEEMNNLNYDDAMLCTEASGYMSIAKSIEETLGYYNDIGLSDPFVNNIIMMSFVSEGYTDERNMFLFLRDESKQRKFRKVLSHFLKASIPMCMYMRDEKKCTETLELLRVENEMLRTKKAEPGNRDMERMRESLQEVTQEKKELERVCGELRKQVENKSDLLNKVSLDSQRTIDKLNLQIEQMEKEIAGLKADKIALADEVEKHTEVARTNAFTAPDVSLDNLAEYCNEYDGALIGGHPNWIKKMSQYLPNWLIIGGQDGIPDPDRLVSKDVVIFYTDSMGHSMFLPVINCVKAKGVKYGYVHGLNPNLVLKQIQNVLQQ